MGEDEEIVPESRPAQAYREESISIDVRSYDKTNDASSLTAVPSNWSAPIGVSPKSTNSAAARDSQATSVVRMDAFLFGDYGVF